MANKPRKITSFNDPKLERQFEEILRFEREYAKRIEKTEREVKEIKEPEEEKRRPNKPTELTAFPSFKLMNVSWNYVSSDNVSYYVLSYSESTDDESTWSDWNNIKLSNVSFYIHENLDPDIDYRYRVAAVSNEGYRSKWSDIYIAGKPGKVSLSEEVAGELIGDYLADGAITESKFDETVVEKYVHEEDNTANISIIGKTADEISSTVAEVYDGGTISGSTIQQNADAINLRVVALDEDGNPTDVNAQLNISQVDGDGYIYIGGDQITLDGYTKIEGDFQVEGDQIKLTGDTKIEGNFQIEGDEVKITGETTFTSDVNMEGSKLEISDGQYVIDSEGIHIYDSTITDEVVHIETWEYDNHTSGEIETFYDGEIGSRLRPNILSLGKPWERSDFITGSYPQLELSIESFPYGLSAHAWSEYPLQYTNSSGDDTKSVTRQFEGIISRILVEYNGTKSGKLEIDGVEVYNWTDEYHDITFRPGDSGLEIPIYSHTGAKATLTEDSSTGVEIDIKGIMDSDMRDL